MYMFKYLHRVQWLRMRGDVAEKERNRCVSIDKKTTPKKKGNHTCGENIHTFES